MQLTGSHNIDEMRMRYAWTNTVQLSGSAIFSWRVFTFQGAVTSEIPPIRLGQDAFAS